MKPKTGIELIAQEREKQIKRHNLTVTFDRWHNPDGELKTAAIALLKHEYKEFPLSWNDIKCRRLLRNPPIKRLAIAGALIAAEIDRMNEDKRKRAEKRREKEKKMNASGVKWEDVECKYPARENKRKEK